MRTLGKERSMIDFRWKEILPFKARLFDYVLYFCS
jgi:hypothetical protein